MGRLLTIAACSLALTAIFLPRMVLGQSIPGKPSESHSDSTAAATLHGVVRDSLNRPVTGAVICLQGEDAQIVKVHTDSGGAYVFPEVRRGNYSVRAEMPGYISVNSRPFIIEPNESKAIDLILDSVKPEPTKARDPRPEFFDEPHFNVAGVTDTTNLGGHGGDTIVRNREALAQAAVSLSKQPQTSPGTDPANVATERSLREAATRQPGNFEANCRLGKFLLEEARAKEGLPYLERASQLN